MSEKYSEIYKTNLYCEHPNNGRNLANRYLLDFCNTHGVATKDLRSKNKTTVSSSNKSRVEAMTSRIRGKVKKKTILGMAER